MNKLYKKYVRLMVSLLQNKLIIWDVTNILVMNKEIESHQMKGLMYTNLNKS